MRAFFKDILLNLYIYCGNRQADKMTVEEVDTLLNALERMSKIYSYIPEEKQKEIILTCLVSDREYQNINVRTVSKWLEQNGKVFFQQECHIPSEQLKPPLEGEERERMLELWKKELAKVQTAVIVNESPRGGSKMREQLNEAGVKFDETKHKKYDPNDTTDLQEMIAEHEASNEEGSEGTGETSGLPDGENNPQQQEREANKL